MSARFALRGAEGPGDVVVVGIDDRSFSALDRRWPFPRGLHGRLVSRLHADGARQIVYDVSSLSRRLPRRTWPCMTQSATPAGPF